MKKKVLIVCGAGIVSGKEIMTLQLLKSLKERGHECYCITSEWGSPDFKRRLKEIGVNYASIRIGFISKTLSWPAIRMTMHQGLYLGAMFSRYSGVIRKQEPDVVIHTNFHHLFLLFPVVKTNRRNFYWSHEFSGNTSFYRKLFNLFNRKITKFIAVSAAVGRSMEPLVDASKIVVVRNGIQQPSGFLRSVNRRPYPAIGIVGQVTDHKGHTVLFNALRDFRTWTQRPSVEIIGGGDPSYVTELKQLAKHLRIDEIIEWKGFITNPNQIYETLDIIVVPTKTPDPYPTVVMEAGYRGIPAIVSDSGGLPEMVVQGVNGMIFKTGDSSSLASVLAALPAESGYKAWSEATTAHAQKHFSVKDFTDSFERLVIG